MPCRRTAGFKNDLMNDATFRQQFADLAVVSPMTLLDDGPVRVTHRVDRPEPLSTGMIDASGDPRISEASVMSTVFKACGAAICVALTSAGLFALMNPAPWKGLEGKKTGPRRESAKQTDSRRVLNPGYPLFSTVGFETAGFGTANKFTGPIADRGSIEQVCEAIGSRAKRGIDIFMNELRAIPRDDPSQLVRAVRAEGHLIYLLMYEGRFVEAAMWTERAIADAGRAGLPEGLQANLGALLGVINLRRGETENCLDCLGPSACIFPIATEAVHQKPSGSRAAVRQFTEYLRLRPEDQGVRWLLNVAAMTLGEHPDKVPSEYLMPVDAFRSKQNIGRFENIAAAVGLGVRGPNMAGGSVFDDFTGDGLPDVFTTSMDVDLAHPSSSTAATGPSRTGPRAPGSSLSPTPSTACRRIMTTTAASTWCCSGAAGKTPHGCRCCGTRGTAPSRM